MSLKEKPGRKQRDANVLFAKNRDQAIEVRMKQRFASGEYHPTNSQAANRIQLPFEICRAELERFSRLPNVAHHATTVAAAVDIQDEHRQGGDPMGFAVAACQRRDLQKLTHD